MHDWVFRLHIFSSEISVTVSVKSFCSLVLNVLIWMLKVFNDCNEQVLLHVRIDTDFGGRESVDEATHTSTHNLATFSTIETLLFNSGDDITNLSHVIAISSQMLRKVVLA